MASAYNCEITISAGEECTINGTGAVQLQLRSGVVEVAGVILKAKKPSVFFLETDQRCLVLYTLEGGSVLATANAYFETTKTSSGMVHVVQLCRNTLAVQRRAKVLVIGRSHSGKALMAHTICNLLRRNHTEDELGLPAGAVFLMDLNAESNCVYAPGCISTVQVEDILWPDTSSAPSLLPFSFFLGEGARPSSENMILFLHFVDQLQECAEALLNSTDCDRMHLVIDAPAPDQSINESLYFHRLIELLHPTHVLTVCAQDGSETWSTFLQEDVQRVFPECEFSYVAPVVRKCTVSLRERRIREYFVGTSQNPLGCAKIVLPLGQLQFVQYEVQDDEVICRKVKATSALASHICALSHAEIMDEVPLAPVAGLLLVVAVDEDQEELVAIIPSGDDLPRRFVIVPNTTTSTELASSLCVAGILPQVEEAVSF